MVDKTLEAFGLTREEMEQANQQAADQMLPVPYDIPGEVGPSKAEKSKLNLSQFIPPNLRQSLSEAGALGYQAADNVIGIDDDYDTSGELLARAIQKDPVNTIKSVATGVVDSVKAAYDDPRGALSNLGNEFANAYEMLSTPMDPNASRDEIGQRLEAATLLSAVVPGVQLAAGGAKAVTSAALVNPRLPSRQAMPESTAPRFNTHLYGGAEDFGPVSLKEGQALKAELDYMIEPEVVLTPELGYERLLKSSRDNLLAYPEGTEPFERAQKRKELLEDLGLERLKALAEQIPYWESPEYGVFVEETLKPLSESLGVFHLNLLEAVNDMASFLPKKRDPLRESVAEAELPYAAPVGPRASPDSPARLSDLKAEDLGFFDTVYHTSSSPKEFNSFDLGVASGQVRELQDLLGVHVGTPRAAAERNLDLTEGGKNPQGFTMELRARTDKPLTTEDASRLFNFEPFDMGDPKLQEGFTEQGLKELVYKYEELLFPDTEVQLPEDSLEQAAVALRKDLANQGYTHIPYINDIEDPGSTSLIMLVDRPEESPAVLRDVRAEFNPEKITDPDLRFAEGGMVLEDQMNTMMAEGGIKDSGMNRDPISGNEIPAGSLAKEVRDDVDAKLSEGEYVVPADVVRYFGVNYFEKLRQKAKSGLEEMDKDGRIGGDPVGEPMGDMDEALSDEEMFALNEMFKGGFVTSAGYQEGGSVTPSVNNEFQLPTSVFAPAPATAPEATPTTLYGPSGDVMVLMLPAEQERYNQLISEGYSTKPIETPTAGGEDTDSDRDSAPSAIATPEVAGGEGFNPFSLNEEESSTLSDDPLAFGMGALGRNSLVGSRGAGAVGGAAAGPMGLLVGAGLGGLVELQDLAKARAALIVARDKGLTDTEDYKKLEREIEGKQKGLNTITRGLDNLFGDFFSGESLAESIKASPATIAPLTTQAIPTGSSTPSSTVIPRNVPNLSAAIPAGSTRDEPTSAGIAYDTRRDGNTETKTIVPGTSAAPDRSVRPVARPTKPTSSPPKKETTEEKLKRGGGFAAGGLVQRPKKKPVAKK